MAKRVSIAVCLTLGISFFVGAGCSSIPDHRKTLPSDTVDGGGTGGGESPDGGGDAGGTGATGSGGTAGTGARGGTGGKGGSSGTGTSGAGGSGQGGSGGVISVDGGDGGIVGIPCGKNVCPDRDVGRDHYPACCTGPNGSLCGLDTTTVKNYKGCIEYGQPGAVDDICPNPSDDVNSLVFTGCCRPNGKCGAFFGFKDGPNFGCVDPLEVNAVPASDCTPAECKKAGTDCQNNSDCCPGPAGDPVCVTISQGSSPKCSDYCTNNRDCTSGCCILLVSGRGACADASECGASLGQRSVDSTCDVDTDCTGGAACSPNSDYGPRLCEAKCTVNATCAPEFCVLDEAGRGACSSAGTGLCSDTCYKANNGVCDDLDSAGFYSDCTLGTDCSDCGKTNKNGRVGGTSLCFTSCQFDGDGKCDDGGPGAVSGKCDLGTDCDDCKPRLGICLNTCADAFDGHCDDGGPLSASSACNLGTDCFDCGIRIGGRDQGVCDGTTGTICVPNGGVANDAIENNACECPDCPWDAVDCKVAATKCDGKALGSCCDKTNPCRLQFDGICSCGGWCDWETPDCGPIAQVPYCDGVTISEGCDFGTPDLTLQKNGKCDCQGACSWEQDCTTLPTICKDSCKSANNSTCDDDDTVCAYGTDCADCGPRYPK